MQYRVIDVVGGQEGELFLAACALIREGARPGLRCLTAYSVRYCLRRRARKRRIEFDAGLELAHAIIGPCMAVPESVTSGVAAQAQGISDVTANRRRGVNERKKPSLETNIPAESPAARSYSRIRRFENL